MPPSADSEAMGNEEPPDHGEEFVRFFQVHQMSCIGHNDAGRSRYCHHKGAGHSLIDCPLIVRAVYKGGDKFNYF